MRVLLLQLNSRHDKAANLDAIDSMVDEALADASVDLIALPEYATFLGGTVAEQWAAGERFPDGEGYARLSALARRHGSTVHVGSMIETDGDAGDAGDERHYNTTVAFGANGDEIARYRKIHLFDVETPGGHVFRESEVIDRGGEVVSYPLGEHRVGCSICYDLRFSELYLAHMKAGCDVLVAPAAFNLETGKDHWEVLCRARAIETQCWMIAPAQIGLHLEPGGERPCYGNAMIVDPWGTVVARAPSRPGAVIARLDFDYQRTVRTNLPSNRHHVL